MTTHHAINPSASDDVDRIALAMRRHLPDIRDRGCEISTTYGPLTIEAHEALPILRAIERILERRLRVARLAARAEATAAGANVCGGAV